jgi:VWFA-related protein
VLALSLVPCGAAAQAPQTFGAGTELVAVDVRVVDDHGVPVDGLTAADFTVEVDGKPRRIVTAEFVDLRVSGRTFAPGETPATEGATPEPPARTPRNVVIVVDRGSLSGGPISLARLASTRLVDELRDHDRVAVFPMPSGPHLDFTTDRAALVQALEKLGPAQFRFMGTFRISFTEALGIAEGQQTFLLGIARRECRDWERLMIIRPITGEAAYEHCVDMVKQEAVRQVEEHNHHVRDRLVALQGLMKDLARLPGPKTVVLVSGGLTAALASTDPESSFLLKNIPDLAAVAQVNLYSFYIPERAKAFDAESRNPKNLLDTDERTRAAGLERLTGLAGGALFELTAGAGWAFARVAREISAHYLLGLEPVDSDRDGKAHDIRVKVAREGVTLRARQRFAIPTASVKAAPPVTVVDKGGAVGLRVATYRLRGQTPEELKLVVVSEVDGLSPARFGLRLLDPAGLHVGDAIQETSGARSEETLLVKPGPYVVKAVVADRNGRHRAVVDQPVTVELNKAHGLLLSDLLLLERDGPRLRPTGSRPLKGMVTAVLELYPLMPGHVFGGAFEVVGPDKKTLKLPATFQADTANRLTTMEGPIDLAALAPGAYTLRARITSHRDPLTMVERRFEVAAP